MKRVRGAVSLTLLAALLAAPGAVAAGRARCPSPHWVGSWTAAPSDGAGQPLSDQTVRMIVAPHLPGTRIRLRLTNRFGHGLLRVAGVTVARQRAGAAIVASTLRAARFHGTTSVTIPAGADRVSDPLSAPVSTTRKLAISIAVAGTVSAPTEHFDTREVNYATAANSGDHTGDATGRAFAVSGGGKVSSGWYFLAGLDVRAAGAAGSVVTLGDSITDGYQGRASGGEDLGSVGREERYPDFLARRLQRAGRPLSALNAGISGNRVLRDGAEPIFGPAALRRLGADVVRQPGVRDVIVLEGINDIGQPPMPTAARLIDGYRGIIARLHAAHLRVLLGTLTPSGGAGGPSYGVTADQIRVPVNRWIRSQRLSDAVVDFDAAVRDRSNPSRIRPAYDGGDHLHFSPVGYRALAGAVPLARLRGGACG